MSSSEPTAPVPTAAQFRAAQQSEEFIELRRTHRSFAFPMTVAFFVWYPVSYTHLTLPTIYSV